MVCALLLTACTLPGDAAPVVKIGLIASFEGVGRPLGYAVLPAVKAVLTEANAAGGVGRYRVLLVALNDDLDPRAAATQARALAQDPDVIAVLGPWESATAGAAAPILAAAGIPTLLAAPLADPPPGVRSLCPSPAQLSAAETGLVGLSFTGNAESAAKTLVARSMQGQTGGVIGGPDLFRPWLIDRAGAAAEGTMAAACRVDGLRVGRGAGDASLLHAAALADAGMRILLRAAAIDTATHGRPTRAGIAAALAREPLQPDVAWFTVQGGAWVAQR